MAGKLKDLTGLVFGRIKVLSFSHKNKHNIAYWQCECECGTVKAVRGTALTTGRIISCGCYNKEHNQNRKTIRQAAINQGKYADYIPENGISFAEFCRSHGLSAKVVRGRLKKGWGIERTLSTPPEHDVTKRNRRSRAKGKKLEKYVVDTLRDRFKSWHLDEEDIQGVASSRSGVDVILSKKARLMFPLSIECKNTVDFPGTKAMQQAKANVVGATYPAVVWHEPNSPYETTMIYFEFEDFINLVKDMLRPNIPLSELNNGVDQIKEKNNV